MQPVFRKYPGRIKPAFITRASGQILSIQLSTAFFGTTTRLMNAAGRGGGEVAATIAIAHNLAATVAGAGAITTQLSTGFSATVAGAGGVVGDLGWGIALLANVGGSSSVQGLLNINHALTAAVGGNGAVFADLSVAAYTILLHMRNRFAQQQSELLESPIRQQANDYVSYLIETLADMGSSKSAMATTVTRESSGADATSATLVGAMGVANGKLVLPRIGPLIAGEIYRVNSRFAIGDNLFNVFFRVIAE